MRRQLLCTISISILLALAAIPFIAEKRELGVLSKSEPISQPGAVLGQKQPLYDWIEELGDMERCSPTGTWDSGSYSYGRWCYKASTFKYFVREYFGYDLLPNVEDVELGNWIGDEELQRKITRMAFEKSYKNTSHWDTSVYKRGLGEPPLLSV